MHLKNPEVFHVGTMDSSNRTKRFSFEGDALSVSLHPEEWSQIARLRGPTWALQKEGGVFLDMLDPAVLSALKDAGLKAGLLQMATRFKLSYFDDELDCEVYTLHATRDEAVNEVDDPDMEHSIAEVQEVVDSPALRAFYPLMPLKDGVFGQQALTIAANALAAAGELAMLKNVDGLWWNETLSPAQYSAPRGSIFPHMLSTWRRELA